MKYIQNPDKPVLTAMLLSRDPDAIIAEIKDILAAGTDAFGFQIEHMKPEHKTKEVFRRIFDAMEGKPAYVTNYRRGNNQPELSDDDLAEQLLDMLDSGATLLDIPGDMFCPAPLEMTYDETAIKKQMALIDEIHARGGEVLMSSHMLKFMPKADVYAAAKEQARRGADISKIVTNADTMEELNENREISIGLHRECPVPFLFLCNGKTCRKHRLYGPALGSNLFLCIEDSRWHGQNQPALGDAKRIINAY